MKKYFDVCCLNRPYDDQTQDRNRLESEAVIAILRHVESEEWSLVSSSVVSYEISRTSDEERKRRLISIVQRTSGFIPVGQENYIRAGELHNIIPESKPTTRFILPVRSMEGRTCLCQPMTGL